MILEKAYKFKKIIIMIVLSAFILIGCNEQGKDASNNDKNGDKKLDEIAISVTHYPTGAYSVPYNVGIEKGFFEEEGINITKIVGSGGGGTTVRNVLSGDLPFGDVATSAAIQAYLSGAPLKIVGGGAGSVDDVVYVTRKDSNINKIDDLVGKKWSFTSPGSVTETTTHLIFKEAGIDLQSLELVSSGGISEGLTMLNAGAVDATVMLDPTYSVQKDDWKTLFRVSEYVPNYQQSVIITSPELIKEDPDLVKRFLTAYQKSVDWIYKNQEEAGKIFSENAEIDEAASISSVKNLSKMKHWGSKIEPKAMNSVLEGMQLIGTLKKSK